ncbi:unnamed protein product [Larinioides sclopetarius]|uniref:Uncharacterized protein n=1 Tax=Larinioides sclopetarius TaxID=280406 RepID=A0AAV1ZD47_9ARAC
MELEVSAPNSFKVDNYLELFPLPFLFCLCQHCPAYSLCLRLWN